LEKRDNYTSDLQASSKKLPNRSRSRKEQNNGFEGGKRLTPKFKTQADHNSASSGGVVL
jgi:hypothetical protein